VINRSEHPVGWALLIGELEDAQEHLRNFLTDIDSNPEYGEEELRIDLGHVLAHLNRAWHRRNSSNDLSEKEWNDAREFPRDLDPIA
jgi:hypothetical protein